MQATASKWEWQRQKLNTIAVHPAADIFPLMDDEALQALVEDIRDNGQLASCVFYKGQLVDGRNRWIACQELGIEPECSEIEDEGFDALAFVVSQNLHRRHLTAAQRVQVALLLKPQLEAKAAENKRLAGQRAGRGKLPIDLSEPIEPVDVRAELAKVAKCSPANVHKVEKVLTEADDDTKAKMIAGTISINAAHKTVAAPASAMTSTTTNIINGETAVEYASRRHRERMRTFDGELSRYRAERRDRDRRRAEVFAEMAKPIPPRPFDDDFCARFLITLAKKPKFRAVFRQWMQEGAA